MWGMKNTLMLIIVESLGTSPNNLEKRLKELIIRGRLHDHIPAEIDQNS